MTEATTTEGGTAMYDLLSQLSQGERDAFRGKMLSGMHAAMYEAQRLTARPTDTTGITATQAIEVFTDCANAHGDTYPPHIFVQRGPR